MTKGISPRQAIVLISVMLGWKVSLPKLGRVISKLENDDRLSEVWGRDGLLLPLDVDRLAGELWRWKAGYWQRRQVQGDFDAWVQLSDGTWRLLHLPWERRWIRGENREEHEIPTSILIWTWPTAEIVGALVRAEDRDGMPAYVMDAESGNGENEPSRAGNGPVETKVLRGKVSKRSKRGKL